MACFPERAQRLDRDLSGDYHLDQRDRIFIPVEHVLPSHVIGVLSLIVLAMAILARYALHLARAWRWIYVVCAVLALYLNTFVAVVQSFLKVPVLKVFAPTQKETPFLVAQLVVMALFLILGILAVKRFLVTEVATRDG